MCINKLKRFQMCKVSGNLRGRVSPLDVGKVHKEIFLLMWWCFCTKSYIISHHLLLQHKPLVVKKYCTNIAENVTNSLHKHHQPIPTTNYIHLTFCKLATKHLFFLSLFLFINNNWDAWCYQKKKKKPPVAQPQRVLILLSLHRLGDNKEVLV